MNKKRVNLVDIPSGVVFYKTNNDNTKYAYYYQGYTRNTYKENPKVKRIMIGKLDEETGKLIPNDNYFELFGDASSPYANDCNNQAFIYKYGVYLILSKIAHSLGLTLTLKESFPDDYLKYLGIAQYMLERGNVMEGCENYFLDNYTFANDVFDDKDVSRIFAGISFNNRIAFFKRWIKHLDEQHSVAFDTTSISSYTRNLNIFEFGYNKDNDDLPQINMAMLFGEKSKLPLYYETYSGSIVDKQDLINVLEHVNGLGLKCERFVMDRGFYSSKNLQYMDDNNYKYLIFLQSNYLFVKELMNTHAGLGKDYKFRIPSKGMYGLRAPIENNRFVHLFFSNERYMEELQSMEKRLATMGKLLTNGVELSKRNLAFLERFYEKGEDDVYQKSISKINTEMSKFGMFAIITNDNTLTPEEVLETYFERDSIEKSYDNLKNAIDFRRLHTHREETTNGKLFIAFLGLILKSFLDKKLAAYIKDYSAKNDKERKALVHLPGNVRNLLGDIAVVSVTNHFGKTAIYKTLSKKQNCIFNLFDVDKQYINEEIEHLDKQYVVI